MNDITKQLDRIEALITRLLDKESPKTFADKKPAELINLAKIDPRKAIEEAKRRSKAYTKRSAKV